MSTLPVRGLRASGSDNALELRGVARYFGALAALSDVTLSVRPGERRAVLGSNGAGKTTLFNCITGYLTPERGDIRLGTESIVKLKPHRRAQRGIGRTFQRLAVFDTMTVEENIQVGVETRSAGRILRDLVSIRHPIEPDVLRRTDEILELIRLEHVRDEPVGGLPTGVGRLVELGRALAIDPAFVLLDEPASGLDSNETLFLEQVLLDVSGGGVSLLLVEHDVDLVLRLCEHIHVLDFGRHIADGAPAEIVADPNVRAAYLGDEAVEVGDASGA